LGGVDAGVESPKFFRFGVEPGGEGEIAGIADIAA
jgi:hypothetical protein